MNSFKGLQKICKDILVNAIAGSYLTPRTIRFIIYRAYGVKTKTRNIFPRCFIGGNKIEIGKSTFINHECFFDNSAPISIGNNCRIGMQVLFCSSSHDIGPATQRGGSSSNSPIKVGDGCWVGARVVILPGVTIGEGCVIAAGSIVTKDCESNGLYMGVPAKRIKNLSITELSSK